MREWLCFSVLFKLCLPFEPLAVSANACAVYSSYLGVVCIDTHPEIPEILPVFRPGVQHSPEMNQPILAP